MNKNSNIGCGVIAALIIITILFVVGSITGELCCILSLFNRIDNKDNSLMDIKNIKWHRIINNHL